MSGAIPLLPIYAFEEWTGKPVTFELNIVFCEFYIPTNALLYTIKY